jgi:hypothetical protein
MAATVSALVRYRRHWSGAAARIVGTQSQMAVFNLSL